MVHKLMIVDDHDAARHGIGFLLSKEPMQVSGVAGTAKEALDLLKAGDYAAAVIDVRMPDMDGIELLAKVRKYYPQLPVVMISSHDNPTYYARAAALGASDFLLKQADQQQMFDVVMRAIERIGASPSGYFSKIQQKMRGPVNLASLQCSWPLTSRETQVMLHVALGLSNKEIAKSLKISVETVKEHVQNILRKIGANDRTDAAVRAVRSGLIG